MHRVLLVPAAAFAVILAGCGGGSPIAQRTSSVTPSPSPSPTATVNPTPTPIPAGSGRGERILLANAGRETIRVGAGGGSVVAVRAAAHGSDLLDITTGRAKPRLIAHLDGGVTPPSVGTNAGGRSVVVLSPCRSEDQLATPACPLVSIDLRTGKRQSLNGTDGAILGDLDHGALVAVRTHDRFAYRSANSTRLADLPLTRYTDGRSGKSMVWKVDGTDHIESLDFAHGTLATVVMSGSTAEGGGSVLLSRPLGSGWVALARTGFGLMDGVELEFRAVAVTPTGVRAYEDGGAESQSFVARWGAQGTKVARAGVKSRLGLDETVALDGDQLITAAKSEAYGDLSLTDRTVAVVSSGPYRLG